MYRKNLIFATYVMGYFSYVRIVNCFLLGFCLNIVDKLNWHSIYKKYSLTLLNVKTIIFTI